MDNLPEEMLIEIFAYLKFYELNNLASISKRFNEIIDNNPALIDEFRLVYTTSSDINVDLMMMRNYQRVKIVSIDGNLLKYLEFYGDNIYELTFHCKEIALKDFKRILISSPNVKEMKIYIKKFTYSDDDLTKPLLKLTLDSLTIYSCNEIFFKILQITTEAIHLHTRYYERISKDVLVKFLKSQKQLKTLHIETHQNSSKLFIDDSLAYVDFQLETLIVKFDCAYESNLEHFVRFLRNQKNLRKFVDESVFKSSLSCNYANILGNFENIEELEVQGTYIEYILHYMPYIEKLWISTIYEKKIFPHFQHFNVFFPNLNNLIISPRHRIKFIKNFTEPALSKCIEIKLPDKVKTLSIRSGKFGNDSMFDDDVEIKIQNLIICKCDNINWLIECFESDRIKLKSLKIEGTKMKKSQREYLESLTQGDDDKKIEKLKIHNLMKLNENHDYVCDYHVEDDGIKE